MGTSESHYSQKEKKKQENRRKEYFFSLPPPRQSGMISREKGQDSLKSLVGAHGRKVGVPTKGK